MAVAYCAYQLSHALLVLFRHKIAQAAALRSERNQNDPAIMRIRSAAGKRSLLQMIDDSGDIAFIGQQGTAHFDHRTPLVLIKVEQGPKLTRTQRILAKEMPVTIIKQQKNLGQHPVDILGNMFGICYLAHSAYLS